MRGCLSPDRVAAASLERFAIGARATNGLKHDKSGSLERRLVSGLKVLDSARAA